MKICLVYDCLFPWTVGGAERWMRGVAESLAADGHNVTYLTRQQWPAEEPPKVDGVEVIAVSRSEPLYGPDGNRTIGEPIRFGWGVGCHLWRHGREYDVVHTASFPYFSLLAVGLARRRGHYRVVADWHEVWSTEYWHSYLGRVKGSLAQAIQTACARVPQRAFCFSELHASRLREIGLRSAPTVLRGQWTGPQERPVPLPADPVVVYAGRLIPEKQATSVAPAVACARQELPDLSAIIFGDGPKRADVERGVRALGLNGVVRVAGFVGEEEVKATLRRALCLLLPSSREGYGMVVVEAMAVGVPAVLVKAPDNAAVEHVTNGVNGFVAESASPEDLASAILSVAEHGEALRERTAEWFAAHAGELSLQRSLERVLDAYRTAR